MFSPAPGSNITCFTFSIRLRHSPSYMTRCMKTGLGPVVPVAQENIKYLLHAIKASNVLSFMVSVKFLSPSGVGGTGQLQASGAVVEVALQPVRT
jgi:hypothetical protein